MKMPSLAGSVLVCMLLFAPNAIARTIYVGPAEHVKTIAEAAALAKDDDIVEIAPGQYDGDVAVWTQRRLTIRGVGQRPVLNAAGRHAEGKAIWVIRDGDFKISNIEFRGARVSDHNGAGIRFEKGKLSVVRCAFLDNQMGILTGNSEDSELKIEGSIFAQAPRQEIGLPHLLYVGRIASLRVLGSRFHGGQRGHLLKSRARISDIRYSLLVDGPGGAASYEADFPNGGDVTLVGNVLAQSSTAENRTVVAYGAEGHVWPTDRLRMVHNTLYSEGPRLAWFLHVFNEQFDAAPQVMTRNNLLVGIGPFTTNVEGQHQGNYFAPAMVLGDPATLDFTLARNSWLRGIEGSIEPGPEDLLPRFEQAVPGVVSAIQNHTIRVPGAIQAFTVKKHPD